MPPLLECACRGEAYPCLLLQSPCLPPELVVVEAVAVAAQPDCLQKPGWRRRTVPAREAVSCLALSLVRPSMLGAVCCCLWMEESCPVAYASRLGLA